MRLQVDGSSEFVISMSEYEYAVFMRPDRRFHAVRDALIELLWRLAKWLAR